jgi:hypothetical protein
MSFTIGRLAGVCGIRRARCPGERGNQARPVRAPPSIEDGPQEDPVALDGIAAHAPLQASRGGVPKQGGLVATRQDAGGSRGDAPQHEVGRQLDGHGVLGQGGDGWNVRDAALDG